jgi:D-sedoheptulose 7-phosphate isomerase
MNEKIRGIIQESIAVKSKLLEDLNMQNAIEKVSLLIVAAFKDGKRIYFCGNEALHCNTSYLTAVANDYSYEVVYSRLIKGIGQRGDVLIGLSTSGNSGNIVKAFETAREKGLITVGMTGEGGGKMAPLSDHLLPVPSKNTPRIQEAHITIGHIICQLVEEQYFGQ